MRNRLAVIAVYVLLAGCANVRNGLADVAMAFYRVPGLAPMPMSFSSEEGAQTFRIEPGKAGVAVDLQMALVQGEIRLIAEVENGGREPVRYDLKRGAVSTCGGARLELVAVEDDPSHRPTAAERSGEPYRAGVREIPGGERDVVTRRYRLADREAAAGPRQLERLDLDDELAVGERRQPVKVRFEKIQ